MKKIISFLLICVLIIYPTMVYAETVPVTKEKLNETAQNLMTLVNNNKNTSSAEYEGIKNIVVNDDTITVTDTERTVTMNYVIEDNGKVKFTITTPIPNGTTFDEYEKLSNNSIYSMVGYALVANIEGADFDKAMMYFLMSYLNAGLKSGASLSNLTVVSDDVEIESTDSTTIKESEFKNNTVKYVKQLFNNSPLEIKDNGEDMINSYVINFSLNNETANSIDLVSVLTVDSNADFSKINTLKLENNNSNGQTEETKQEEVTTDETKQETITTGETKKETVDNPKTGSVLPYAVIIIGGILTVILYYVTKKNKLYKL